MQIKNQSTLIICLTALTLAMGVALYGNATRTMPVPSAPAVVATVNIQTVFDQVPLRAQAEQNINLQLADHQRDIDDLQNVIEGLKEDVEAFPAGSESRTRAEAELLERSFELRGLVEIARQHESYLQVEALRGIYEEIRTAAREVARQHNIDMVIVDDSVGELMGRNQQEMNAQIGARRILFSEVTLDITDDIIAYLN